MSISKKNLAIIKSPFQLICLNEYLNEINKNPTFILIIPINKAEITQYLSLVDSLSIKNYKIVLGYPILNQLRILFLSFNNYNKLILGHFYDNICQFSFSMVKNEETVFLDDGVSSLSILEDLKRKRVLNKKKHYLKYFYYKRLKTPVNFKFYTLFHQSFPTNNYFDTIENNLNLYASKISNVTFNSMLYFIGDPMVEFNMIKREKHESLILKLNKKYDILYFPHRREHKKKLDEYAAKGIKIYSSDLTFESFIISQKIMPSKIAGFISTALITTRLLLINHLKTDSFFYVDLKEEDFVNKDIMTPHTKKVLKYFSDNKYNKLRC